jgi:hypothetical protein
MTAPRKRVFAVVAVVSALAGCATRPPSLYTWGNYEDLVYTSHASPGSVPPEKQIEILEADLHKAVANNERMPPGWHANLGYLYIQIGRMDEGRRELLNEKTQFPESGVFVDRLLANLKKN